MKAAAGTSQTACGGGGGEGAVSFVVVWEGWRIGGSWEGEGGLGRVGWWEG